MWGRKSQAIKEAAQLADKILDEEGIMGGVRVSAVRGLTKDGTLGQTWTTCWIEIDEKLVSLSTSDEHAKKILEKVIRHEVAHVIALRDLSHGDIWMKAATRVGVEKPDAVTPVSEELRLLLEG